jgi:hypothetical protein
VAAGELSPEGWEGLMTMISTWAEYGKAVKARFAAEGFTEPAAEELAVEAVRLVMRMQQVRR